MRSTLLKMNGSKILSRVAGRMCCVVQQRTGSSDSPEMFFKSGEFCASSCSDLAAVQVYIKGDFVGGSDILMGMHQSGELTEALEGVEKA